MMVVSVVVTAAGAMLTVVVMMLMMLVAMALLIVMVMLVVLVAMAFLIVVMMLVVLVAMALFIVVVMLMMLVAMALFIVMMMLMMLVAMALLIVMVMLVMLVAMALLIVVMMLVMLVAMAFLIVVMMMLVMLVAMALLIVMVMLVMVMMLMVLMLLLELSKSRVESILLLHSGEDVLAVKLVPRGGNDSSGRVVLSDELDGLFRLISLSNVGMRKNDTGCVSNLIVVELTKVLHIHLALINVCNRGEAVEDSVLSLNRLNSLDNVRELTYSAGLDNNSVGMELVKNLGESLRKIANERATDTAGVHLGDLDACILKEAAVNTDLAKLVLYKHKLFTCVCFLYKLLDKRSLTCAEEAGKNIYFRHIKIIAAWANLRKSVLYYNYTFLT